ncbi:Excisionase [Pseudoalteromonas maricaloris]
MLNQMSHIGSWIPQEMYLRVYGEEKSTLDERIRRKHWVKGTHYNVPRGSKGRWINIEEVNKWAAGQISTSAYLHAN